MSSTAVLPYMTTSVDTLRHGKPPLRFLSLFSGIEAASAAWCGPKLGWECAAVAEIEDFPCQVLRHHFPDVPNLGDVTKITEEQIKALGHIDVVVFGSPCTDVSIAGKRAGLKDAEGNLTRSGLFFTAMEIVRWAQPNWFVFENVPGLLSSNKGADAQTVFDEFESSGYVIDADILDAQFYGVPQRRRRVFVCGQHVESLLRTKTTSSAQTISQCLSEISHGILLAFQGQSAPAPVKSVPPNLSSDGLLRRMRLFGLQKDENLELLRRNLGAEIQRCLLGPRLLESPGDDATDTRIVKAEESLARAETEMDALADSWNTGQLWRSVSDVVLLARKLSITSMPISEITTTEISTCFKTVLNIARLMSHSNPCCPTFWAAGSSTLTALKEYTNYARSASSQFSEDVLGVHPWDDFLQQAEQVLSALGNTRVSPRESELLSLAESLLWHPKKSGKKRKDVAPTLSVRTKGGGGLGTDFDLDGGLVPKETAFGGNDTSGPIEIATARNACPSASGRMDFESETFLVREVAQPHEITSTLDANYAHTQGTSGQEPSAFNQTGAGWWNPADAAATVRSGDTKGGGGARESTVLAFSSKDYAGDCTEDISPTLRGMGFDKSHANAGGQVAVLYQDSEFGVAEYPTAGTIRAGRIPEHQTVIAEKPIAFTTEHSESNVNAGGRIAVAFVQNSRDEVRLFGGDGQTVGALAAEPGMKQSCYVAYADHGLASPTSPCCGLGLEFKFNNGNGAWLCQGCRTIVATGGSQVPVIAFTTEQTPKTNEDCALTLTKQSPTGGGQPQCVAYGIDEEQNVHKELMGCLKARERGGGFEGAVAIPIETIAFRTNQTSAGGPIHSVEITDTLAQDHPPAIAYSIQAGAVRENPESGPDGVGVRTDNTAYTLEARAEVQAVAFDTTQLSSPKNYSNPQFGDPCHPLAAGAHPPAVAFETRFVRNGRGAPSTTVPPLKAQSGTSGKGDAAPLVMYEQKPVSSALEPQVTHSLRADGFDASEDGTGRGTPLVPVAFRTNAAGQCNPQEGGTAALTTSIDPCAQFVAIPDAIAFQDSQNGTRLVDTHATLDSNNGPRRRNGVLVEAVAFSEVAQPLRSNMAVRRLTPRECERLQGFPDSWTLVPTKKVKKPGPDAVQIGGEWWKMSADGPRYKALGNSMAVPCMVFIGERIQAVEDLINELGLFPEHNPEHYGIREQREQLLAEAALDLENENLDDEVFEDDDHHPEEDEDDDHTPEEDDEELDYDRE